tara:strand:- start:360 stop:1160 length:801 start_codon:yes stop_codon:yes gene_type:complete
MNTIEEFAEQISYQIRNIRTIDVDAQNNIFKIINDSIKKIKLNIKSKSQSNNTMRRNEKQKHFKFNGEKFKGKNDKFLRIAIEKSTNIVRRVKPINWTFDARDKFYELYPDLIYIEEIKKPKKKVSKSSQNKKKVSKSSQNKVSTKPKIKKEKISTFDLIASLVNDANKANTSCKKEKESIKKERTPRKGIEFKKTPLNLNKKKKTKVKKHKKEIKKNVNETIEVREFYHETLENIHYIDENNNIWNDNHELIGNFDNDENIIKYN